MIVQDSRQVLNDFSHLGGADRWQMTVKVLNDPILDKIQSLILIEILVRSKYLKKCIRATNFYTVYCTLCTFITYLYWFSDHLNVVKVFNGVVIGISWCILPTTRTI